MVVDLALHAVWPRAGRWHSAGDGTGGGVPGLGDGVPDHVWGSDAHITLLMMGVASSLLTTLQGRAGQSKAWHQK